MYRELVKDTPNTILLPSTPLACKALQNYITEDDVWNILEHILCNWDPNIGGKAEDLQKQIYDLWVISTENIASFINSTYILHNNIILPRKYVSP